MTNLLTVFKSVTVTAGKSAKVASVGVGVLMGGAGIVSVASPGVLAIPDIIFVGKEASPSIITVPAPQPMPAPTPTPTPAPTVARPSFNLGVNVGVVSYWSGERAFANLATGSSWMDPNNAWQDVAASEVDSAGSMKTSRSVVRLLTPPAGAMGGAGETIRCTWEGAGSVTTGGTRSNQVLGDHQLEFFWPAGLPAAQKVWIDVRDAKVSDPLRNLDCREKWMAKTVLFAPEFVDSLKPYGTVRFLDWSQANANPQSVTWAQRTQPNGINQQTPAIEHMLSLATQLNADPWFTLPWNGDEDYVRRYAQLVHDTLPQGRKVYVELGNEPWNFAFPLASQIRSEGLAEKLSGDQWEATYYRYAEKTTWAMKIWTEVFADRPAALVRVVNSQHGNAWIGEQILGFRDTANWVDALATAPYFGGNLLTPQGPATTDLTALMSWLTADATLLLDSIAAPNAAVAAKYKKRFIAYEAGQHVLSTAGVSMVAAVNRDQRMYDIYKAYITDWKKKYSDTMVLYGATGGISQWGAWGLREYAGQPLSETPKRRAAVDMGRQ